MCRLRTLVQILPLGILLSCASRPIEEITLADVAVKAAQKAKADSFAPDAYRKAENFFLRAKRDYQDGYYESARKYSTEARQLAEQAEYQSIAKQTQSTSGSSGGSSKSEGSSPAAASDDAMSSDKPPTQGLE